MSFLSAIGGLFGLNNSGPNHSQFQASAGLPGVGATNPYLAQQPVIPVPQTMAQSAFQASAPTVGMQASLAPLSNFNFANALNSAQGIIGGNGPASGYIGNLGNLAGQNVSAGAAGNLGSTAGQLRGLAGQNVVAPSSAGIGSNAGYMTGLARQNVVAPSSAGIGGAAGNLGSVAGTNYSGDTVGAQGNLANLQGLMGRYNATGGTIGQQQGLANMLAAQSLGAGPSLAQLQLQQATDRTGQQAAGLIASQRGINPGAGVRTIANQAAGANQQAANQSAQVRAAEQFAAEGQLGNVLQGMGGLQLGQQQTGIQGLSAAGQTLAQRGGLQLGQQQNALQGFSQQANAYNQQGALNLGQQLGQGTLAAQAANAYNQQGQLNLGQQQTQMQGLANAGNLYNQQGNMQIAQQGMQGNLYNMAAGQAINQLNAGTNLLGTAGGLYNQQNALNLQNWQQTQGLNANIGMANAGYNLAAQGMNQQTAAQNAGLAYNYAGLAQNAYAQNASNYLATEGLNAGIYGQNAQLTLGGEGLNAATAGANAATNSRQTGGLLSGLFGGLGLARGGEIASDGGVIAGDPTQDYTGDIPEGGNDQGAVTAPAAVQQQKQQQSSPGGNGAGLGAVAGAVLGALLNQGGEVPSYASGGDVMPNPTHQYTGPLDRFTGGGEGLNADSSQQGGQQQQGLLAAPMRQFANFLMQKAGLRSDPGADAAQAGGGYYPGAPSGSPGGVGWEDATNQVLGHYADGGRVQGVAMRPFPGYGAGSGTAVPQQGSSSGTGTGFWNMAGGAIRGMLAGQAKEMQNGPLGAPDQAAWTTNPYSLPDKPIPMSGGLQRVAIDPNLSAQGDAIARQAENSRPAPGSPLTYNGRPVSNYAGSAYTPEMFPPSYNPPGYQPPDPTDPSGTGPAPWGDTGLATTPHYGVMMNGPRAFAGGGDVAGSVPGQATVSGDSPANDTVPIEASPGEIVLPRSVAQAPDAPERAAAFVRAIQAKKATGGPEGYGAVLAKKRELAARRSRLEAR